MIRIGYLMHGARNVGGGELLIASIIKKLRPDVFHPVVFYAQENDMIRDLSKYGIECIRIDMDKGMISVFRNQVSLRSLRFIPGVFRGIKAVRRAIRDNRIDILHPHDNLSKIIGGIAAIQCSIPCVAHCHDLLRDSFVERVLLKVHRYLMSANIAVSDAVCEILQGSGVGRVATIENGIDFHRFAPVGEPFYKLNKNHIIIGTVAMLDPVKGHKYLFDAVNELGNRGLNVTCLVVGSGTMEAELKDYAKKINGEIVFMGYRRDVHKILPLMDFFVMPSLRESFCIAVVEAMAARVPVIATSTGGLKNIITHEQTGLAVTPGEPLEICNAIARLIEDDQLRNRITENACNKARDAYSIDTTVRKTENFYLTGLTGRTCSATIGKAEI